MSKQKKGYIPVMLTPFKENGAIDFDALTQLIEFYLSAGASGLFANCQSSEMFELSPEERLAITTHTLKVTKGRVPVVAAATFDKDVRKQADFIKRMYDTGIEAAIVLTNMLVNKNESDVLFEERVDALLANTGDIPLGFYECPVPYKSLIPAQQLEKFVDTGRITYLKDTSCDIDLVRDKLSVTKDVQSFSLYDAYMAHAVKSLESGSAGVSCIQGNYFPELVVWLCENYDNKESQKQVNEIQQFFIKHMDVMHEEYPKSAKYILQKRGLNIGTYCRVQKNDLSKNIVAELDELLEDFEILNRKLLSVANPMGI